jgi:Zn-dependent M28 family amino/carboxypeptidase
VIVASAAALVVQACATTIATGGSPAGAAVTPAPATARIDAAQMLAHVKILSADSLQGRRVGTPGGTKARAYLTPFLDRYRLLRFGTTYEFPFAFSGRQQRDSTHGVNLVGYIRGTAHPDQYIVVSGHYDHVGIGRAVNGDSIYNGADDNASGAAAVLALAQYFTRHAPQNSIIFALLDGEESGLQGARAFVRNPPVPIGAVAIDVNMDMVSRNDRGELYATGTFAYPPLLPYVERAQRLSRVILRTGHEGPSVNRQDDWTNLSDQGPFNDAGIPFLYLGVEDHPDYHRPSDEYRNIQPDFYARVAETVLDVVLELDRDLAPVIAARHRSGS